MHTPESLKALQSLRAELAWLKATHPDKLGLIGLAEAHLQTIDMAGSTKRCSIFSGDAVIAVNAMFDCLRAAHEATKSDYLETPKAKWLNKLVVFKDQSDVGLYNCFGVIVDVVAPRFLDTEMFRLRFRDDRDGSIYGEFAETQFELR